jgi:hypothetical protein
LREEKVPRLRHRFFADAAFASMNNLIVALNIVAILFIAYFFREKGRLTWLYWIGLILKVSAGISVGLIYFYYYQVGDTILFARDAKTLSEVASKNFFGYCKFLVDENSQAAILNLLVSQEYRSLLMIKIVSLFSLICASNYWIIATYLSVISFYGTWYFVKAIEKHFPNILYSAILAFVLFPSTIFWSSGVIKESLALGALFFLSGVVFKIWFRSSLNFIEIAVAMISCWLSWKLKYYYAGVFFLVAFTCLLYKLAFEKITDHKSILVKMSIALIIFIVPVLITINAHPNFRPSRILSVVVENYNAFISYSAPEDVIMFRNLSPTISSVIQNAPKAILCGLYRPFIWEVSTIFQLIISIENLLLLVLSIFALFSFRYYIKSSQWFLSGAVIIYILLLVVFITLSTPNFGTLSRYRISFIPYFVLLLASNPAVSRILEKTFSHLVRDKQ